jgi:FimV-like protein
MLVFERPSYTLFLCSQVCDNVNYQVLVAGKMKAIRLNLTLIIFGVASMILSSNVHAIALGKMRVDSTQLRPLRLQIDLGELQGIALESISAKVAGADQFRASGMTYQGWYSGLDLKVVQGGGRAVLQVRGKEPIYQEKLDLIFDVDFRSGRELAVYRVQIPEFSELPAKNSQESVNSRLIEPQETLYKIQVSGLNESSNSTDQMLTTQSQSIGIQKNAFRLSDAEQEALFRSQQQSDSGAITNKTSGQIQPAIALAQPDLGQDNAFRLSDAEEEALFRSQQQSDSGAITSKTSGQIQPAAALAQPDLGQENAIWVKPGQTLWRISINNSPSGVSVWQMLMALYKANPKAFRGGNISRLIAKSYLGIPDGGRLRSLSTAQSKAEYELLVGTRVTKPTMKRKPIIKPAIVKHIPQQPKIMIASVKPEDALLRIPISSSPEGVHQWQTLMALYKANPEGLMTMYTANPESFKDSDIRYVLTNSFLDLSTLDQLKVLSVVQSKIEPVEAQQ